MAYGWPEDAHAMYCPNCLGIVWLKEISSIYEHLVYGRCKRVAKNS